MKSIFAGLRQAIRRLTSRRRDGLDPVLLKEMARGIVTTRGDEIGCEECFEQMDRFVDMTLAGHDAAQAMPLVQDHLTRCGDCRQEFEALLAAVQAMA